MMKTDLLLLWREHEQPKKCSLKILNKSEDEMFFQTILLITLAEKASNGLIYPLTSY